ncbi:MAG: hypothetical protein IPL79_10200 [Myxococcales bacterium]|nr:hypothetical protein [Myxococcales bacterium]
MRKMNGNRTAVLLARAAFAMGVMAMLGCSAGSSDAPATGGSGVAQAAVPPIPGPPASAPPSPPGGNDDGSGGGGGGGDGIAREKKKAPPFTIVQGKKLVEVTEASLASVPTTTAPVGDKETQGWEISAILTANGFAAKGRATLFDLDGVRVEVAAADWNLATTRLFLKRNAKGQWRFRMYKKVRDGWNPTSEMRGMTRIVLR